jgi:hypothetical protein
MQGCCRRGGGAGRAPVAAPWEELIGEAYLTLRCAILDGVSSYRGGGAWGTHQGGSSADGELQSRACGSEAQALIFGDGGGELQGAAHNEAGQNGCGASCRAPTSVCWSLRSFSRGAAMKRAT